VIAPTSSKQLRSVTAGATVDAADFTYPHGNIQNEQKPLSTTAFIGGIIIAETL
jgi:hypothetical protein